MLKRFPRPWRRRRQRIELPAQLPVNWVLAGRLAVGPLPSDPLHWQQLEKLGLRARFSCCYEPELQRDPPPPEHWYQCGVPLPDHRRQEDLDPERLREALSVAIEAMERYGPLYVHCYAGRERSSLVAIGVVARIQNLDIFSALDWVRRNHPAASPLFDQLEVLETILAKPAASA